MEGKAEFEVNWRPFFLNRDATRKGVNKLQYYNDKFGAARVAQMVPFMQEKFRSIGIEYSMGGNTGNTMDSHRLITYTEKLGSAKQNELVEELFNNYFCEEKFLGDRAVLLAAAKKCNIDGAEEFLADESNGRDAVMEQLSFADGVSGVPFFRFSEGGVEKAQVSGGVPPQELIATFNKILK